MTREQLQISLDRSPHFIEPQRIELTWYGRGFVWFLFIGFVAIALASIWQAITMILPMLGNLLVFGLAMMGAFIMYGLLRRPGA